MEKVKKYLILLIIISIIIYSFLGLFNTNVYAVSQSISADINSLNDAQYPGIKERINSLKAKYPNWNFKIFYTDLDWNDVISNEYVGHNSGPRNMVEATSNYQGEWICSACSYKNGLWRCASEKAIRYMMDPRNSLNESDIFQFEELTNSGHNINTINSMISGTFLQGNGQAIANAANNTGINAYYIIARLIQEQGRGGSTLSNGSRGYYNPFNIQANGNTESEEITNGINYAKSQGWDTLEKGITGGINFLANQYIKKGQNTLYLQKFDVESSNSGLYWHQYMQNIMAAQSEGTTLRTTYQNINSMSSSHTFIIPVYRNMPAQACSRPNTPDTNTNDSTVTNDLVKVNVTNTINLRSSPNGTIIGYLKKDEIVTRIEKANSRNGKTYWDKIRKADGTIGYVARETDYDESAYKLYLVPVNNTSTNNSNVTSTNKVKIDETQKIITVSPDAIAQDILDAFGGKAKIVRADNNYLNGPQDSMSTGFKVEDKYTVIKKGDSTGDGKVDTADLLNVQKQLLSIFTIEGIYKQAADTNNDNKIDTADLLSVQKKLLNISDIQI